LKLGPARRVDPGPGRPGAGTGPGWWKNGGRKNPMWPGDPADPARPGQDPVTNPLTFVFFCFFFTKTMSFWFFFKKRIDPADPVKPGDPAKTRNPGLGPGRVLKLWYKLKKYVLLLIDWLKVTLIFFFM